MCLFAVSGRIRRHANEREKEGGMQAPLHHDTILRFHLSPRETTRVTSTLSLNHHPPPSFFLQRERESRIYDVSFVIRQALVEPLATELCFWETVLTSLGEIRNPKRSLFTTK